MTIMHQRRQKLDILKDPIILGEMLLCGFAVLVGIVVVLVCVRLLFGNRTDEDR
jgi:hypothetical protein